MKVLQEAKRSLELKEIAEQTGQNYKTLRMTLSRMVEAGLIVHPYRGYYTTLELHAERQKTRELEEEAFKNFFATDAKKKDSSNKSTN